ncbi:OmpA family protein [uncultured Roseobacter sp.]|uniref:OmpA family protein n=1 Tax=uncultured Roseobacter sp. TaxID=114847 RepID=UPI002603AEAE|nr:OmpA family protein [uncultured Roseobacter sp.]
MRSARVWATIAACCLGAAVQAVDLSLPEGARMTVGRATSPDSFAAPVAGFDGATVPSQTLEGSVNRQAWRIETGGMTSLQAMAPLRAQLEARGFEIAFECSDTACGGFDFRFAVEVLPSPNMYVNIGAFRYLTAFKGPRDAPEEAVTILASVTGSSAYVQVIHARTGPVAAPVTRPAQTPEPPAATTPDGVDMTPLLNEGAVVLSDLDFDTGSSSLGPGPFASLERLAALLSERPELRIALVGHTDTVGGLAPNIALSRDRARSVRARLIEQYLVAADRLDAEGMGYLAPIATNSTAEGRDRNRRVEAVLLEGG